MSASLSIFNGCKIKIDAAASSFGSGVGFFTMEITETDGATHEITVHFDTEDGFARAKQIAHLAKAVVMEAV